MNGVQVDYLEAGSRGPSVILVHSSVFGAVQWRRLIADLQSGYRVRAVNLFGYGKTPPWSAQRPQSLADQARLVERVIPDDAEHVCLVGHSFGGSVAMKAAARIGNRVKKLVLLEPNPIYLLLQSGRVDLFEKAMAVGDLIKSAENDGDWTIAASTFADYWGGAGSWNMMSPERKAQFVQGLRPNYYEWDVVTERTSIEDWSRLLPRDTLLVFDPSTVAPIREIVALFQKFCPWWTFEEVPGTGHMAPLTHPHILNPIVASFLAN